MVALGREEHLGLMSKPPECLAVDDAVAVPLITSPEIVVWFGRISTLGSDRERGALGQ
jgi:hypothetical protein